MPYHCPANKLSIGIGRNLEEKGITQVEALFMLNNDIIQFHNELLKDFPSFNTLDDVRQNVLIEMAFNLGLNGLLKFKSMIKYIEKHDFLNASIEMLDSKWHRDFIAYAPNTPIEQLRSSKLSKLMKEGKYV